MLQLTPIWSGPPDCLQDSCVSGHLPGDKVGESKGTTQRKKSRHKIYQGRKLSRLITLSINSTWLVVLKPDEEMGMAGMLNSFVMIYLASSDWAEGE